MALRKRRVLRAPWWIIVAIFLVTAFVVGAVVRFAVVEENADHEAVAVETATAVSQELTRSLSRYYTPTVAAGGFLASMREQAAATGMSEQQALADTWPTYAEPLIEYLGPSLLDFQLAPEAIVTYSARPEVNKEALGHNLLVDDARRDQILAAIEDRGPIVAGPLDLLQGGRGLIIRQAVFLPDLAPFEERFVAATGDTTPYEWLDRVPDDFWGMATTVINFDAVADTLTERGFEGTRVGVFPVSTTGDLGESIWGDLPPDASFTDEEIVTLLDGSQWVVRVDIPPSPLSDYWPVLVIALIAAGLVIVLAEFAYRGNRRAKYGFAFSEAISQLTTRQAVLERTSAFLTEIYPGIRGRITSPEPHPCDIGIPVGSEDAAVGTSTTAALEWRVLQAAEVQCVIEVEADGPFHAAELNEIIALIRRILGASLAALGREGHLERRATVDHLTSVFNRSQLEPTFARLQEEADRSESWLVVAYLDIDDFKGVNDSLGHLFGDEVLTTLADALTRSLRATDAVVRLGGDEFIVLATVGNNFQAADLCRRIQQHATAQMTDLARGQRSISVSLGYVTLPGREPMALNDLMSSADAALYEAKASGGAHVREGRLQPQDSIR